MTHLTKTLPFLLLLAIAAPLHAQSSDGETTETATEETATDESAEAEDGPGTIYVAAEYGDWQNRCIRGPIGQSDLCQMFYQITDDNGHAIAEFTILKVEGQEKIAASGTILTPLDVLLPPGIEIFVDGQAAGRVPYITCTPRHCAAEFSLKPGDVGVFKKGNAASFKITALREPPQPVTLPVSLKGFTASYNELVKSASEN